MLAPVGMSIEYRIAIEYESILIVWYSPSLASQTLTLRSVWFFQNKHAEGGSGPLPIPVWIQPAKMLAGQSDSRKM